MKSKNIYLRSNFEGSDIEKSRFGSLGNQDDYGFTDRTLDDQNNFTREIRKRNMDMTIEDRDLDYY